MKIIKFFGVALLSMALCVNFSSCGDDDEEKQLPPETGGEVTPNPNPDPEPEPNPGVEGKKLVEYCFTDDATEIVYQMKYDDQGRIASIVTKSQDIGFDGTPMNQYTTNHNCTWEGDKVKVDDGVVSAIYTISNNKIVSMLNDNPYSPTRWEYAYDNAGQLVGWGDKSDASFWNEVSWQNGIFHSVKTSGEEGEAGGVFAFEYENRTCKGYNPFYYEIFTDGDEFPVVHAELFGKIINTLPGKINFKGDDGSRQTTTVVNQLDSEGYVVHTEAQSVYTSSEGEVYKYSETYDYIWE